MTMETVKVGKSIQKYLRISPQKVRLVLDTIRSQGADQAMTTLKHSNRKAARLILTGLKSALANAKVLKLDEKKLFVSVAKADVGPTLKRFLPRSMGRADRLLKRTSHITVIVREGKRDVNEAVKTGKKEEVKEVKSKEPKAKKEKQQATLRQAQGGEQSRTTSDKKQDNKKTETKLKKTKGASK
jgi:large subunit ribosomal protein L22